MIPGGSSKPPGFGSGLFELHPTLDALSTFIYVKDRDLRVVSANLAFCQALGVTRDDLIGKSTAPLLGDGGPESDRIDRQVLSTGIPCLGFVESFPGTQGRRWVITDKAPVSNSDGTIVGLIGTSIDITVQREADERLKRSEAQLRFVTDHMADILWTMDLAFNTTFVTPSIERMLGFTPEERMQQKLEQMAAPESVARIYAELAHQMELEASGSCEPDRTIVIAVEYYHKNGTTVWTENSVSPLRDSDGRLIGMFGVSRDITARRQAEEALRRSEAQLRFLTENAADVIWTLDLSLKTTYISPSVERVLGYTPEEWLALPFDRMATPESVQREYAALQQQLELEVSGTAEPDRTVTLEVEMNHKDGSTVWMEMVIRGIRDDGGKLTGLVGVSRDIRERRGTERALQENAQLLRHTEQLSQLGGWAYDVATRHMTWTQGVYDIHEMDSLAEIDHIAASPQCYDPGAREQVQAAFGRAVAEGVPYDLEVPFTTAKGSHRWVRTIGRPEIRDGAVVRVTGNMMDVTEQHRSAEVLRASEQKYRQLFEQSVDAVNLVAADGTLLEANPAWYALFGYAPDDTSAFNARDVYVDPDGRERFLQAIAARDRVEDDVQFRRKDGSIFECHRVVTVRRDLDGTAIGYQTVFHDVTEQRRAAAALKESEERYRSLFEQSVDAINLVSFDGRLIDANPAWYRLFGYSPDDADTFNAPDVYVDPDARERFLRDIAGKDRLENEVQFRRKDGTVFDCHRVVTVRRDRNGAVIGYQTVFHDVTEQKLAEAALRESEERYRTLVEQSMDAIWSVHPDGSRHEVNQAWLDMFGYSREEVAPLNVADLYAVPEERSAFLRRMEGRDRLLDEVRFRRKDGSVFVCQRSVVARRDQAGTIVALQGVSRDVTEQRKAEQALRESEEKYRSIFDQAIAPMSLFAADGTFVDANDAWLHLFGYSRESAALVTSRELYFDPADRDRTRERVLIEGRLVDDECRMKTSSGAAIDVQRSIAVQRNSDGTVSGYLAVWRDITEQKRVTAALKESEQRFRLVLNRSPIIIAQVDRELRYVWIYQPHPDFEAEGVFGKRDDELADNEGTRQLMELKRRVINSGEAARQTISFPLSEGRRTYDVAAEPLQDENGTVIGATTVAFDVTERVAAEEALRASEERYRQLFDQSIVPISLIAPDGRIIEANEAWLDLLGYSHEDVPSFNAICLFERPEEREALVQLLLRKGYLDNYESRIRRKDGTFVDALRAISVRYNPDGSILGFQTVLRDVTELHRAQNELLASREQLRRLALRIQEAREDERTAIAQQLHDHFGQQLTALKFDLEAFRRRATAAGGTAEGRLRDITALVDRMADEIRRVITEMRPGMLDDLGLSAAIEWQAGQFSERSGIPCTLSLSANDAALSPSAATALFRVCQELLGNIARHSRASAVQIELTTSTDSVRLVVADNGRGITESELNSEGSLGVLSIQERIRACGGTVVFHGAPGKGTSAVVQLPLGAATDDAWQTRLGLG